MGDAVDTDPAHGLVEGLIQALPVGLASIALAQYTLQQTGALGELGVVDFFDFVMAVAQHQPADQRVAEQDHHQYRDQNARADRDHACTAST
ncbi:hypothetical protein D3C78_1860360 [compost metagenome]